MYPTSTNFCVHFYTKLAAIVLLILYTKCIQKFVEVRYRFCIHFVHILYTSVVHILYSFFFAKCIHSFRVGSVVVMTVDSQLRRSRIEFYG